MLLNLYYVNIYLWESNLTEEKSIRVGKTPILEEVFKDTQLYLISIVGREAFIRWLFPDIGSVFTIKS